MVMIPVKKSTGLAVDDLKFGGEPRTYLGMSGIGEPCLRKQWYKFHWAHIEKHDAKTERIFEAGHLFEAKIISQLKLAGMEVFRVDENGNEIELFGYKDEEQEEFIGFAKHVKGHCDGRIRGVIEAPKTVHVLELKTMMQKYFLPLRKKGVKEDQPVYYGQTQRYMKATGLDRTLFIALNKNTSELYFERIEYDAGYADDLVRKEQMIIIAHEPPVKAYPKGFFKCGDFCEFDGICHEGKKIEKNCRTCEYADIENDGLWTCQKRNDKVIPVGLQRKGCSKYKLGWEL